tara:strand:+ start:2125 stop:2784 length:660 start_codon:yes stop_codon:yes gene_type:complete
MATFDSRDKTFTFTVPDTHQLQPRALSLKKSPFQLFFRKTYSTTNLLKKINLIIDDAILRMIRKSVDETKDNLKKSRFRPLAKFTLKMREQGYRWSTEKRKERFKTSSKRPLHQTGDLLRSIKVNKANKSLDINAYGIIQNKGFTSQTIDRYMNVKWVDVPPRTFISLPKQSTSMSLLKFGKTKFIRIKPIRKIFNRKLRKAFKATKNTGWTAQPKYKP